MITHQKLEEITSLMTYLNKDYPTETRAFSNFMQKAEGGSAQDKRMKELINVAPEAGASRDEVMSAGFMAVLMHGGPALMYLTPIRQALDELVVPGGGAARPAV
ncbi:MAG: carboxymuconolactone decarboxylase family protein [Betaproteobacteria bacterium]|nr:carboxymuconolactone decarboxylase family protein [Betaproteobacteria bacterium]